MKKALSFIMATMAVAVSCTARQNQQQTQPQGESGETSGGKKVLVAYFSCTGTTEAAAKAIAEATDGTLYRIEPKQPYTSADLDWRDKQSRSSRENDDPTARPELANNDAQVELYDVVFVGFPVWWNVCPRAVNTFMETYDFKGKTVVPFATSGGSSIANSERELRKAYSDGITWKPGKLLNGSEEQAKSWAAGIVE